MGWGICFGLDENGNVYCADGCKWRTSARDYEDFVPWPSARAQVLEYFENDALRELDMIRDEFPGTAAGLRSACEEHLGSAFSSYYHLSDEEKIKLHEEKMSELTEQLEETKKDLLTAREAYNNYKKVLKEFVPSAKRAKTRADELRAQIAPLQIELDVEVAAGLVDLLMKNKNHYTRQLNKEKKFQCSSSRAQ